MCTIEEFEKVEIRIGTIVNCQPFLEAKNPAFQLWIDVGESYGIKKSSAQITINYQPEELIGTQVLCVVNLPPKKIAYFISEVLVLGFPDKNENVVLCSARNKVPNGARLY